VLRQGLSRRALLAASAALAAGPALAAAARPPVAETAAGRVSGVNIGPVKVFRGVPYGAPTGGEARWLPPRPPASWPDVRPCLANGEMCPQVMGAPLVEEAALLQAGPVGEDCLKLNIFTPEVGRRGRRRAVMVWFHGGGMASGSGAALSTDGTSLARKQDVVVVTVTHRLNVHGFLHLGDIFGPAYAQSGNVGLLDCLAALQWVQANISDFGGDPRQVMILGQAGGAAKVSTLMAMPGARGLFHRAAAHSGAALGAGVRENATANARRLMAALDVKELAELQAIPSERLVEVMTRTRLQFGPFVDGAVIPADPYSPAGYAVSRDVPLILGSTETEATFFPGTPLDPIGDGALRRAVQQATRLADREVEGAVEAFRAAYPGRPNHEIAQLMLTQFGIAESVTLQSERRAEAAAPTWLYHFAQTTPVREGRLRSPHTLDIPYVFDTLVPAGGIVGPYTDANQLLADRMGGWWANFARTGNPNGRGLDEWRPFDLATRPTLILDAEPRTVDDPFRATREVVSAYRLG
jgi:para-nitrobenzyl esterase